MSPTPVDIASYNAAYDIGVIIENCGEFPNVPLLGTRGGISYNSILARRQFGYPMRDKPNNILLADVFYFNKEGNSDMRERFVRAWHTIHKKEKNQLGKSWVLFLNPIPNGSQIKLQNSGCLTTHIDPYPQLPRHHLHLYPLRPRKNSRICWPG
jgi:hypothetical protein